MKKKGILNSDMSRVVADMGHMDWLACRLLAILDAVLDLMKPLKVI